MSRGYFAVDRAIFDHPIFADEPFTEREAWQWMISEAAWRPTRIRVGRVVVNLDRGQLAHSLRFMADKWQWTVARVRRFLDRIKTDTMIATQTGTGVTVITICNYNKYQGGEQETGTPTATQTGNEPAQKRHKEEELKPVKNDDDDEARPVPLISEDAFRVAEEVGKLCGIPSTADWPPSWCGAPYKVQHWLNSGWSADQILAGCKVSSAKKRDGPPTSIAYFEKAIAEFIARQSAPVPKVEFKQEVVNVVQRSGQSNSGSLVAAAGRILEQMRAGGSEGTMPAGGFSAAGDGAVRLLPPSRRGGP